MISGRGAAVELTGRDEASLYLFATSSWYLNSIQFHLIQTLELWDCPGRRFEWKSLQSLSFEIGGFLSQSQWMDEYWGRISENSKSTFCRFYLILWDLSRCVSLFMSLCMSMNDPELTYVTKSVCILWERHISSGRLILAARSLSISSHKRKRGGGFIVSTFSSVSTFLLSYLWHQMISIIFYSEMFLIKFSR